MMELDQTNEFLVTPRQDPFFNPNAAQAVVQVKQNAAPHGPLTRIGYSAFSGGMMANSDSLHRIEATCTDKGTFLRVEEKEPFKKRKEAKYLAPIDVWQTLCAFAEREQLAALCELKGADPMQGVMDYSSSAHIELEFNDKPLGGSPYVSKSVELYVLDQHGLKEVSDTLLELLDGAVRKVNSFFIVLSAVTLLAGAAKLKPRYGTFIQTVSSTTLGVFMIHDNKAMIPLLWRKLLRCYEFASSKYLILHAFGSCILVFAVCVLIDLIRQKTVGRLEDKLLGSRIEWLDEKVNVYLSK